MNLFFDFTVDKAAKTIRVTREFAADLDLVWDAFTKAEILDQWTAPKPYRLRTKEMEFREGGRWLYAMVSPDNTERWSMVEFISIEPKTGFSTRNTFCDENGVQAGSGFSLVRYSFKAGGEKTTMHMEKVFDDLSTLERIAEGYKIGFTMGLANLDEYFSNLVTSK